MDHEDTSFWRRWTANIPDSYYRSSNGFYRIAQGIAAGEAGEVSGMAPELKGAVEEFLAKNKVVLFMKGTKQFPQCGFSNTCVQVRVNLGFVCMNSIASLASVFLVIYTLDQSWNVLNIKRRRECHITLSAVLS